MGDMCHYMIMCHLGHMVTCHYTIMCHLGHMCHYTIIYHINETQLATHYTLLITVQLLAGSVPTDRLLEKRLREWLTDCHGRLDRTVRFMGMADEHLRVGQHNTKVLVLMRICMCSFVGLGLGLGLGLGHWVTGSGPAPDTGLKHLQ